MNKEQLRLAMKERRKNLTPNEVNIFSNNILNTLYKLDIYKNSKTIMTYISAFKEPLTLPLIEKSISIGKKIIVPITHTDTGILELSYLDSHMSLKSGAYNILEPEKIIYANKSDIDLIIVPGIAFDKYGNRVGFGKGYYDKLLANTRALKVAFCYSFQITNRIATDVLDIPMDILITENEVVYCDKN